MNLKLCLVGVCCGALMSVCGADTPQPLGEAKPDRVKTCYWRNVPLSPGRNDVEVRAGSRAELDRALAPHLLDGRRLVRESPRFCYNTP